MQRRIATALLTFGLMAAGVGPAAAGTASAHNFAAGFGTFSAAGSPNTNHFAFAASTTTNGSGGDGFIGVADFQNHVFYTAQVTCLFIDPTTQEATIWGQITHAHTAGAVVGGSVLLNVTPGTASSSPPAGFGNYLFGGAPPTHCLGLLRPEADPIKTGAIFDSMP
jgi:hypothetical protein